ncbi:MAG: S8 family peptidase [Saprospiraceae bacterium]|nr:S8 family peptidase [Saprospiraceae bacterium]
MILNPEANNANEIRDKLVKNCFKLIKKCPCGPGFELYEYPPIHGIEVAATTGAGASGRGIGDGLLLNVLFEFDEPKHLVNMDSFPFPDQEECSGAHISKIAIVDSGVDLETSVSQNELMRNGWLPFNDMGLTCVPNDYPRGIFYLDGALAGPPNDEHGHGSSVNSVAIGLSSSASAYKFSCKLNNVRVTANSTKEGNLFDALCGLYYAANQNPDVINISWGFENIVDPQDIQSVDRDKNFNDAFVQFSQYAKNKNIVIVAGAGNGSIHLCEFIKFYPASVAATQDNFITVGAINGAQTDMARFSNRAYIQDNLITVSVPGEDVVMAYPKYLQHNSTRTGYVKQSGTSFAAPLVTNIVAMTRSFYPDMPSSEIKTLLLNYSQPATSSEINNIQYQVLDYRLLARDLCRNEVNFPPAPL